MFPSLDTEEEKKTKRRETVGREVEKICKYAAENGLDLPTPLNNWHTLKRNVEEIAILGKLWQIASVSLPERFLSLCQAKDT